MGVMQDYEKTKPTYKNNYQTQIDGLYDKYINRPKFEYAFDSDPVYQQYRDQYVNLGQRAMKDTQAKSAALTGGFGNSYGVTAGSEAYQNYLDRLTGAIPQLEQNAYSRYQQEGNNILAQLNALKDREQQDYDRYQDAYNQWLTERNLALSQASGSGGRSSGGSSLKQVENDIPYNDIDVMKVAAILYNGDDYNRYKIDSSGKVVNSENAAEGFAQDYITSLVSNGKLSANNAVALLDAAAKYNKSATNAKNNQYNKWSRTNWLDDYNR